MLPGLNKLLFSAIETFFSSAGFTSCKNLPSTSEFEKHSTVFSASIGLSGDNISGALVVTCARDSLLKSHPQRDQKAEHSEEDLGDWSGEIANQVIGLLKRSASGYGVSFYIGTPTVIRGHELAISTSDKSHYEALSVLIDTSHFIFYINMNATSEISFEGDPKKANDEPTNDMLFF